MDIFKQTDRRVYLRANMASDDWITLRDFYTEGQALKAIRECFDTAVRNVLANCDRESLRLHSEIRASRID